MNKSSYKSVSISGLSVSDATPPVAVVEYTDATGTHVETFASNGRAWTRYNVIMAEMGMRRI